MLAVKNKLNSMKLQSELSEDRIQKFEAALNVSKHHLEAALQEKDILHRKIEAVEMQIINANKLRESMLEKCKSLERQIDDSVGRRKELQNREVEGDEAIQKLEAQLKAARDNHQENAVRCEEAERRLQVLTADSEKVHSTRLRLEKQASQLEKEIDQKLIKLSNYEQYDNRASEEEYKRGEHMRLLEEYYRDAEERKEIGRLNTNRLQRIVEQTQDEIEVMRMRSKAAQVELQNVIQTVIND